jgi:hypothetical protein
VKEIHSQAGSSADGDPSIQGSAGEFEQPGEAHTSEDSSPDDVQVVVQRPFALGDKVVSDGSA